MEDIRFYDFEFNLLHIASDFISSNWNIKYNGIGTFEAHFDLSSDVLLLAESRAYLVAKQGEKTAVITGWFSADDVVLYGRTCNWLLSRRVTLKFKERTGTVEQLCKQLVEDAFFDTPALEVESTENYTREINFWRNTLHPASEVIKDCLDNDGAGHEVVFDIENKKWVFRVLAGENLALLISEANRNAQSTEVEYDCLDYFTGGWYALEADEENEEAAYEFLDAGTGKEGIYRWDAALSGTGLSEAKTSMEKKRINSVVKARGCNLIWKEDYNLGDTVRVEVRKGKLFKTEEKKITGVEIWYENNDISERPILEGEVTNVN